MHCCSGETESKPERHIDPVCKMTVAAATAKASYQLDGVTYYFCCQGCSNKFQANSDSYLKPAEAISVSITRSSKNTPVKISTSGYTCPMHPEIVTEVPDDCPLCGMALESMMPTAVDETADAELKDITKRLALSAAFTLPVVLLSMSQMLGMSTAHETTAASHFNPHLFNCWAQFALATPVVAYAAIPFFVRGAKSLSGFNLNMFTLLSLGIGLPYLYSFFSLLAVTLTTGGSSSGHIVYFESATVIATLAWVGQLLEAKARIKSTSAVRELVTMLPTEATVILPDGSEVKMPIGDLIVHAQVKVRPGERIAVDGVVVEGRGSVNESLLTGEPMPVLKEAGSNVSAGTMNVDGSLVIDASRIGVETMLFQIVHLVSQAQRSRVPVQKMADRVASVFVPSVLAISLLTMIAWLAAGSSLPVAMSIALAVLVVACPCALGLATPMSIVVASGVAAKAGVLFKEARSLQLLAECDTLVIDKTGTLTVGAPRVANVVTLSNLLPHEILAFAAAVEHKSEHPLAAAVVLANRGKALLDCKDFKSSAGLGITGSAANKSVAVGSSRFLKELSISVDAQSSSGADSSLTSVFVAVDGQCVGRIDFHDAIRAEAKVAIQELQNRGLKIVMATGDGEAAANHVATILGITQVHSSLLPSGKAALVKELQSSGAKVAMAGDGINDAPALAQAGVGIAMGAGTDVALQAADIVLILNDIQGLVKAHKVSKAMLTNITENLWLAFGYNLVAIPLATGLFASILGFTLNPMAAAVGMSLSSVAVIANALRLKAIKL
jgi:Cu+-exporting ATPase